jgi:PAS domain-containing protein
MDVFFLSFRKAGHMGAHRHLHDRLGSALFRLASLKQRASEPAESPRSASRLLTEVQKLVSELERTLVDLQQAMAQQTELQKHAQVASRRAALLFELMPVACVILDADGTVIDVNPPAVRLLNVSHRHLAGKAFSLFLGAERELFLARLQAVQQSDAGERWPATIRPRERSAVRATLLAAPDPDGRIMLLLVTGPAQEEAGETIPAAQGANADGD